VPPPVAPAPAPAPPPPVAVPGFIPNVPGITEPRAGAIRIEGSRQYGPGDGADTDPRMATPVPARETKVSESSAAILTPSSGHDIIRETKLKVLQRHYESRSMTR
jgi:hypothetical protein